MQLWKWITSLFSKVRHQSTVESFVASKYPQTTADVEYWIRAYYQGSKRDWAI